MSLSRAFSKFQTTVAIPGFFFQNLDEPFVATRYTLSEMKKTFYPPKLRSVFITDWEEWQLSSHA